MILAQHSKILGRVKPEHVVAIGHFLGVVIDFGELRNLHTGGQVQAQNPLAVVRRIGEPVPGDTGYPVLFAATLVYPYFVEMTDPISG